MCHPIYIAIITGIIAIIGTSLFFALDRCDRNSYDDESYKEEYPPECEIFFFMMTIGYVFCVTMLMVTPMYIHQWG